MSAQLNSSAIVMESTPARWGAFSYPAFTVIWAASIFLNVGNAMFDTSSAWLMTSLKADRWQYHWFRLRPACLLFCSRCQPEPLRISLTRGDC